MASQVFLVSSVESREAVRSPVALFLLLSEKRRAEFHAVTLFWSSRYRTEPPVAADVESAAAVALAILLGNRKAESLQEPRSAYVKRKRV